MKFEIEGKAVELSNDQIAAYAKLTKLQRGFVAHWLQGKTPTESHRLAGGKARKESHRAQLASEILNRPDVQDFIALFHSAYAEPLAKTVMTRDEMAERLTLIARTTLDDVLIMSNKTLYDEHGELAQQGSWSLRDPENMRGAGVGMLNEMTVSKQGIKIKTHDQVAAMRQLADLMGWNKQQVELSGEVITKRALKDFYGDDDA